MSKSLVSIIIPALNESLIIVKNIDEIKNYLLRLQDMDFEIIVVDDGSTDNMYQILIDAQKQRNWLKVIKHQINMGRGRGIRTGFEYATGDYVICLDADLSYSPEHIETLIKPLVDDEADITIASPYHNDGLVQNVPLQRAMMSKWGNKILSRGLGLNLSTVTCIVRGFKREVLQQLELVNNGKELHLEILHKAKLLNLKIKEVPAKLVWRDKSRGKEKNKGKLFPEISFIKMRKTILSHLVFNFISNPGLMLSIPILFLICVVLYGSCSIAYAFINNLLTMQLNFIQTVRLTMLNGELSLLMVLFSSVFLMLFLAFYFISFQMKYYFDELYILLIRINNNVKK
jgi:dolichol-phosphate mannosyltransferase